MAIHDNMQTITVEADADLSAAQFHFVKSSADGQAALCGDGEYALGVVQNDPAAAGRAAEVAYAGKVKVEAAEAITAGSNVSSNANGEAVNSGTGDVILGTALSAASGDGAILTILFHPRGSFA